MTDIPDWTTDPEWPTDDPTTPQSEDASGAMGEAGNDATPEPPPELYFGSTDEFVREFVCPVFRRNVGEAGRAEYRWSARWWESAEAVIRLEAMWRSWEQARPRPRHRHQHLAPRPRRLSPRHPYEPDRALRALPRHRERHRPPAVRGAADQAVPGCSRLT